MIRTVQKTNTIWLLIVCLLAAVGSGTYVQAAIASSASNEDPQPILAKSINELLERLKAKSEEIKKDQSIAYAISDELIAPHIDFPRIARLVIGKYWRGASDTQREQLIAEIRELLVRSYVTAMTSYIDELVSDRNMIEFQPSRYAPGDRKASVRANIALGGREPAEVDYQLYFADSWKIYDIRIEGVSLAITYRTSFGEQIQREGLDRLIAQLAERNRKGDVELPDTVTTK